MEKVIKWVEKYEESPIPSTVGNAKRALNTSQFYKFMELTGYEKCSKRKSERRKLIESLRINEKMTVEELKKDQNIVTNLNKDGFRYAIVDHITIIRHK